MVFAVMRWTTDNNKLSLHNLKYIIDQKEMFQAGEERRAVAGKVTN